MEILRKEIPEARQTMGGTRADQSLHPLNLLAFYDFPAGHWIHLRTTNPLESVFATVRQRTNRTKGSLSPQTAKLMVFKLVSAASKTWCRLKGTNQLPKIVAGVRFADGIEVITAQQSHAA
jgi:transposase-like protein